MTVHVTPKLQTIRQSLKILSNDVLTVVDLIDSKLGIHPDQTERVRRISHLLDERIFDEVDDDGNMLPTKDSSGGG